LALIFMSVMCVAATTADCLPGYIESITPGTSVDVVFSSGGGDPQVITSTSPSSAVTKAMNTHSSEAYDNYYLNYYLTPGFVGAPLIGEYSSLTGGFSQYTISDCRHQGIQSNECTVGIPNAGDLIASKKKQTGI